MFVVLSVDMMNLLVELMIELLTARNIQMIWNSRPKWIDIHSAWYRLNSLQLTFHSFSGVFISHNHTFLPSLSIWPIIDFVVYNQCECYVILAKLIWSAYSQATAFLSFESEKFPSPRDW